MVDIFGLLGDWYIQLRRGGMSRRRRPQQTAGISTLDLLNLPSPAKDTGVREVVRQNAQSRCFFPFDFQLMLSETS